MRKEAAMLPERARIYLLEGLSATSLVVETLLKTATPADYDRRPDPERFTLREVAAHLADWESEWLHRMRRINEEEQPILQAYDEGQWAIERDYAHADVDEQVALFSERRKQTVAFLRGLSPERWERTGRHVEWGPVSIEHWATLVLGHDGYHTRQIAEWLSLPPAIDEDEWSEE
jgi:hypothetical protein